MEVIGTVRPPFETMVEVIGIVQGPYICGIDRITLELVTEAYWELTLYWDDGGNPTVHRLESI